MPYTLLGRKIENRKMIRIDLDLKYLADNYGISAQSVIDRSGGNSITEIMDEEGENGNSQAVNFKHNVLFDWNSLIKAFRLDDALNRYMILQSLNPDDLMLFLERMDSEDLAIGLKFFKKEKLLFLLLSLKPERLFELLKEIFSLDEIVKLIPEEELDKFLLSCELKDEDIMKYLEQLPPEALAQFLQAAACVNASQQGSNNRQSGQQNSGFRKAVTGISKKYKSELAFLFLKNEPKSVKAFSPLALVSTLQFVPKEQIATAAGKALEPSEIINLIGNLPQDLLAMVATQLDKEDFSKILINNFQNVLSQISL